MKTGRLTPNPSQEGSTAGDARWQFPSWEGLGVGSVVRFTVAFHPSRLYTTKKETNA